MRVWMKKKTKQDLTSLRINIYKGWTPLFKWLKTEANPDRKSKRIWKSVNCREQKEVVMRRRIYWHMHNVSALWSAMADNFKTFVCNKADAQMSSNNTSFLSGHSWNCLLPYASTNTHKYTHTTTV